MRVPVLLCLTLHAVLTGCAGHETGKPIVLDGYAEASRADDNYLIAYQSRLALPVGWVFEQSKKKQVFFKFNDTKDNVLGKFSYYSFDFKVNPDRAAEYFVKNLRETKDKILSRTYIDGRAAHIVQGKFKGKYDEFQALVVEGRNINVIRVVSDPGYLYDRPGVAYRIFASYRFVADRNRGERRIPGNLSWRSTSGKWKWLDNMVRSDGGGFQIAGSSKHPEVDDIVTGAYVYRGSADALYAQKEANLGPAEVTLTVAGETVRATAIGKSENKGDKTILKAWYRFERDGKQLVIYVGTSRPLSFESLAAYPPLAKTWDTEFYHAGEEGADPARPQQVVSGLDLLSLQGGFRPRWVGDQRIWAVAATSWASSFGNQIWVSADPSSL